VTPGGATPPEASGRRAAFAKLAVLAVLLVGSLLIVRSTPLGDPLTREGIDRLIESLRGSPGAPLVFVAAYAVATALAIPGTIMTLAGGALFGLFWGTVYNTIAANLGANAAFLIARYLGRDAVERIAGDRLARMDRATREHGFQGLLTLRLVPLVPFNALNFGSGLTALPWRHYATATVIGILPGTIVYTMFADALLAGSREASREAFLRVALSGGLLLLLSFLPTLLKKMKVKLPGAPLLLAMALVLPPPASLRAHPPQGSEIGATAASSPVEPAGSDSLTDASAFTDVLRTVVRADRVDYARLKRERSGLDRYLLQLEAVDPGALAGASREARLAFWINAYNACMLRLVVDHYPIRKATGILDRLRNAFADRPANSVWQIDDVFTREHCAVAGELRSQDEIEHEIIRPLGEPRIHFAVNCAARSCPPLATEAYTAERLDEQLDAQVRRFVADPRHLRLEKGGEPVLYLNKVLDWFKDDFGGVPGVVDLLAPHLEAQRRRALGDPALEVRFFDYDWALNDVGG
jgi:uncharacterized membrane protein YdjX (TVP38/TMEM64 family)